MSEAYKRTDNKNPLFSDVNSNLRRSWAAPMKVTHPIQRVRQIASLHSRLSSAVHVVAQGPMLAGHSCNRAVMWDVDCYTGFDVANEASSLLLDVLLLAYSKFTAEEVDQLHKKSLLRKAEFDNQNGVPVPVIPTDFLKAYPHGELLSRTGAVIYTTSGSGVDFIFCQTTRNLLAISTPIVCSASDFMHALMSKLSISDGRKIREDIAQINAYLNSYQPGEA